MERLQANYFYGSAMKISENKTYLYLSCTTKNNTHILIELILIKSNYIWCEIKYKSESGQREAEIENFLYLLLSEMELQENMEDLVGR